MSIKLSQKQQDVLEKMLLWTVKPKRQYLTLGGYAGTGKTTIISEYASLLHKQNPKLKIAFCSYTGKATRVMKESLTSIGAIKPGYAVSTIHRLIYSPILGNDDEVLGWEKRAQEKFPYGLIIVDEASMLNENLWKDLLSFGVPVLAVGDHGQLPPIEGNLNLMQRPDLRLEEIYRQQKDNPIIQLSELARETGKIPFGRFGQRIVKLPASDSDTQELITDVFRTYDDEMLVLTGYNHTRVKINAAIRQILEIESAAPIAGDRVICLKNNYKKQIYNGMMGYIKSLDTNEENSEVYDAVISLDGEDKNYSGQIFAAQFGARSTEKTISTKIDSFDFGYAITVHKAQGSQAQRVVVFEERFQQMSDDDWKKWLYTAVTRAISELYIVGSEEN